MREFVVGNRILDVLRVLPGHTGQRRHKITVAQRILLDDRSNRAEGAVEVFVCKSRESGWCHRCAFSIKSIASPAGSAIVVTTHEPAAFIPYALDTLPFSVTGSNV
jgi:hypothetical protein